MAMRMQNVHLHITEFPKVEAVVENKVLYDDVAVILQRVQVTMAKYLHNGALTITLRLAEQSEVVRRLTPYEFMQKLVETNKEFAVMKETLKLELE